MSAGAAVPAAFFGLGILLSIWMMISPDPSIRWTIRYYEWSLKFMGLEAEIRATSKSRMWVRVWAAVMIVLFVLAIVAFLLVPPGSPR